MNPDIISSLWFNNNTTSAIPLIALLYNDIELFMKLKDFKDCVSVENNVIYKDEIKLQIELLAEYIYLEENNRKLFAESRHEYLIEQIQYNGDHTIIQSNSTLLLNPAIINKINYENTPIGILNDEIKFSFNSNLATSSNIYEINIASLPLGITNNGNIMTINNINLYNINKLLYNTLNNINTVFKIVLSSSILYFQNSTIINKTIEIPLNFINPVKDLIWGIQKKAHIDGSYTNEEKQYDNYGINKQENGNIKTNNPIDKALLKFNGLDRFRLLPGSYFNYVQPYENYKSNPSDGINVYSFALKPEEHQPSGTCNFSRLDIAQLKLTLKGSDEGLETNVARTVKVYAVNYNILRIMRGMGGLAYNN